MAHRLRDDVARMTAYYGFAKAHWKHLRTTNIIESNFAPVRSRTNVCKGMRNAGTAAYLVWELLMRRKSRWRRFDGYASLTNVHRAINARPLVLTKAA